MSSFLCLAFKILSNVLGILRIGICHRRKVENILVQGSRHRHSCREVCRFRDTCSALSFGDFLWNTDHMNMNTNCLGDGNSLFRVCQVSCIKRLLVLDSVWDFCGVHDVSVHHLMMVTFHVECFLKIKKMVSDNISQVSLQLFDEYITACIMLPETPNILFATVLIIFRDLVQVTAVLIQSSLSKVHEV